MKVFRRGVAEIFTAVGINRLVNGRLPPVSSRGSPVTARQPRSTLVLPRHRASSAVNPSSSSVPRRLPRSTPALLPIIARLLPSPLVLTRTRCVVPALRPFCPLHRASSGVTPRPHRCTHVFRGLRRLYPVIGRRLPGVTPHPHPSPGVIGRHRTSAHQHPSTWALGFCFPADPSSLLIRSRWEYNGFAHIETPFQLNND